MKKRIGFTVLVALVAFLSRGQQSYDITVRRAPYTISSVSTKSENATTPCRYCGSKCFYTRTYKWDVYNHVWVETTDRNKVADVCRKCRAKLRSQERLDLQERDLDRKINYESSRARIRSKKALLRNMRDENNR